MLLKLTYWLNSRTSASKQVGTIIKYHILCVGIIDCDSFSPFRSLAAVVATATAKDNSSNFRRDAALHRSPASKGMRMLQILCIECEVCGFFFGLWKRVGGLIFDGAVVREIDASR